MCSYNILVLQLSEDTLGQKWAWDSRAQEKYNFYLKKQHSVERIMTSKSHHSQVPTESNFTLIAPETDNFWICRKDSNYFAGICKKLLNGALDTV